MTEQNSLPPRKTAAQLHDEDRALQMARTEVYKKYQTRQFAVEKAVEISAATAGGMMNVFPPFISGQGNISDNPLPRPLIVEITRELTEFFYEFVTREDKN